ncbi:coiled-coil domain-containing protein 30 isoform X1 [Kryptolebias marmoratus]|uniref:coiled-coil domain-containing protein 30 isoform X1 n=1 Tax=Kryptolebias marmoratus TaxID=37003 RepID=UPI0007F8BEA9|nr:coiled-coil domain-containing protein 30 isoform X1 [Kryptolebias marmoratus]
MDHQAEDLDQIATWLGEEGLAPDSSKDAQLCSLWRTLLRANQRLGDVTKDLETNRSQHFAEMAEVRKSLEQIRMFTEEKDALAQEIQDENNQLRKQLRHFMSLQDAQISEVAKMLYQQGLTELIHSSPSEQVAYLLVERASLLETNEDPYKLRADGNTGSCTGIQALSVTSSQSSHKRTPRHLQSSWKRLFGLHKVSRNKHAFTASDAEPLAGRACGLEKECSRLERDVEEGSRRLAMAHNEIRHLTDELESAHLTQRAYEPELLSAQQEVEQLGQEVEKLKKCEMAELRKAKELNDRLNLEILALRDRVRSLNTEKKSLQQTVVSLQEEMDRLRDAVQGRQDVLSGTVQVHKDKDKNLVEHLQMKTEQLEPAVQKRNQKLLTPQDEANQAAECDVRRLQLVGNYHSDLNNLIAKICTKEQHKQKQKQQKADSQPSKNSHLQMEISFMTKELQTQLCRENTVVKECPDCKESRKTLLSAQNECETLKNEICETLKRLDSERSKYHNRKEKHKEQLCQARQKIDYETMRCDEKTKALQRELSLCSHSLAKGGLFGDGKQETGKQNTAHVQPERRPGTQPAECSVSALCRGATEKLKPAAVSFCLSPTVMGDIL